MWPKIVVFSFILSLSSCGSIFSGLREKTEELISDTEIEKCNKERRYREDLDTFLQDIEEMKKQARNYEVQEIYSYCLSAKFSYSKDYNTDLNVWRGEAYNTSEKTCDAIYKIYKSDFTTELDRETSPENVDVIKRSEHIKKELLEVLDQAKKTAEESIPKVENRIEETCESDE